MPPNLALEGEVDCQVTADTVREHESNCATLRGVLPLRGPWTHCTPLLSASTLEQLIHPLPVTALGQSFGLDTWIIPGLWSELHTLVDMGSTISLVCQGMKEPRLQMWRTTKHHITTVSGQKCENVGGEDAQSDCCWLHTGSWLHHCPVLGSTGQWEPATSFRTLSTCCPGAPKAASVPVQALWYDCGYWGQLTS